MRIALLNPQGNFDPTDRGWTEHPDFGGQLVYVKEVALAMGQRGHQVDIITRRMEDPEWPEFSGAVDRYPGCDGVRILRFPCGPPGFVRKEALWPHLHEWVDRIVAFYRAHADLPDAVSAHYGDGGLAAVLLGERLATPFTFTAHSLGAQKLDLMLQEGGDIARLLERFRFEKRLAAERVSMARAGRVITSSRQERFRQYGHVAYRGAIDPEDDRKFAVVPPGVNLEVFDHAARNEVEEEVARRVEAMLDRDIAPERRGLPLVICSSRLESKKNHAALVRAWAVDPALRGAANLVLVVRGSSDPLRQRGTHFGGEALRILDRIAGVLDQFDLWSAVAAFDLNSQRELAAAYRHLAAQYRGVFCLPALHEPFGLAPLEAMAAGLPAVATRNGGPSETLREDGAEYGVLVDPRDPADIAKGLRRLLTRQDAWRLMQARGRERVDHRFTWRQTADGYLEALERLLRGETAGDSSYPKPTYFEDPSRDDLTPEWLRAVYPVPSTARVRSPRDPDR